MIPHLLRCRGLAVAYYSFVLGRLGYDASSTFIEKTERHAAQAPALRERYHKSSIFNRQYSIWFRLCRVRILRVS